MQHTSKGDRKNMTLAIILDIINETLPASDNLVRLD